MNYMTTRYRMTIEVEVLMFVSDDPDWIQTPKRARAGLVEILDRQLNDEPGGYRIVSEQVVQNEVNDPLDQEV